VQIDFQEQVETLNRLGLTVNQSKIFIALVQSKPSTVAQIAKSANLVREVVYRTLPKLERTGLITKMISFPTEFKAVSIDLATRILLEKRAKETSEVKTKATELVTQIRKKSGDIEEEPQLISVSGKEHLLILTKRHLLKTKLSIDTIIVNPKFSFFWGNYSPIYKKLLAKKVKIRLIIAGCKDNQGRNIEEFKRAENFKIKFIPNKIQAGVGIIDNEQILINTLPNSLFKASFYWSNDPGVLALCSTYFEKYWNSAESAKIGED
jgi:sugar-specific transcriptional regulator TrmB